MDDRATPPRPTPWDVVFGGDVFDEARFVELRDQAAAHGATSPTELFMLPAAGALLRDLLPTDTDAEHRAVVAQTSALMFHAFRFWLHGRTVVRLDDDALRPLLDRTENIGDWAVRTPAPAGYVQLPRNVLWARVSDESPAEPADGFFWSHPAQDEGVRGERLDLLLCLGVRRDRPGLSLVEVAIEAGGALQHWADVEARPAGIDFDNVLPGGELQDYRGLLTQAEVLKLASRVFHYLDARHG
jgi:hypothetical protein